MVQGLLERGVDHHVNYFSGLGRDGIWAFRGCRVPGLQGLEFQGVWIWGFRLGSPGSQKTLCETTMMSTYGEVVGIRVYTMSGLCRHYFPLFTTNHQ